MSDIVERLRDGGVFPMTFGGPDVKDVVILYDPMTPTDAIKEIERLRADNARMRGIIENVTASWFDLSLGEDHMNGVIDEARRALASRD